MAKAEPLGSLVARIAHWLPGRVIVADAAIGRTRIRGLFDISDPGRAGRRRPPDRRPVAPGLGSVGGHLQRLNFFRQSTE
ncbi:hypothetical protein [Paracoccus versutus]